jgi:TP901 family phage tail tape measure protein
MPTAVLSVLVQARGIANTNRGLASTQGYLTGAANAAGRMGKQLATVAKYGAVAAAAGIAVAVKKAVDFDKAMRNVNSIAQLGERRFGKLRERVLALAGPTAQAPKTLAAGLYDLVSSGFNSSESLRILAKSARAATAGLTTTEISTKAVAAVLNAYHLSAGMAGDTSDVLFEIVNRGVISFEELASQIGDVLPFSASLDVNLREVGASIATMTKAGINAPETMTRIKAVMVTLLKPGKMLNKVIREQGYESGVAMIKQLGFQGTLDKLAQATGGSKAALAALFPNVRALGGALALTGENSKVAADDLAGMQDASGATGRALSQQSRSIAFQWQRLTAQAEVLAVKVGDTLLPAIGEVITIVSDPRLTTDEKISKAFDVITKKGLEGFKTLVGAAERYGPKIIGALATGMASAWTDMSPLAKLFTVGAVLRLAGGKGAITAAGAALGRTLGLGVATGATETAALSTVATAGAGASATAGQTAILAGGRGISATEAATGGAVAGQAAGASMGGGIVSALKSVKWARVGMLGAGVVLADEAIDSFGRRTAERSDDLREALGGIADSTGVFDAGLTENRSDLERRATGAKNILAQYEQMLHKRVSLSAVTQRHLREQADELDLTKKQREQVDQMLRVARQGSKLGIKTDLGMDPHKLELLGRGFGLLRSGALTSLQDINKVTRMNMGQIAATMGLKSKEGRDQIAENFRSTVIAIGRAMAAGDISVKGGLRRQKQLFREANLISGDDPLGIASGFERSWKKAGGISTQQRRNAVADLGKMPPAAREKAYDSMIAYGKGLVAGGKIPKQDLRDFQSAALAQFDTLKVRSKRSSLEMAVGVSGNFGSMVEAAAGVLSILKDNTNNSLGAFGAKPLDFAIKAAGSFLGIGGGGKAQKKQAGGFIVAGTGSGDRPGFMGEVGAFVMNREATKAYGLNRGGGVPLALEPGERYLSRPEVKAMGGARKLEAINRSVPRFQKGGEVGHPQISGAAGPLLDIGQGAVDKVASAAESYVKAHKPKGLGAMALHGSVGSHPELQPGISAIVAAILKRWPALAISSTTGGGHAENSLHYQGRAADLAASSSYMLDAAGWIKANLGSQLTEGIHNPNLSIKYGKEVGPEYWGSDVWGDHLDHIHVGKQLGGLIRELSTGGPVPSGAGDLVGASYYGGPTDGVSGTVGAAGVSLPGKMSFAELAMGEALGGLPFHTKLKIGYNGKSVVAEKLDIGLGGDDVGGHNRAIDLWYETANAIGMPGTGVVKVSPADGSTAGLSAGQKKAAEGKARKANHEHRLEALQKEANSAQTAPSKQSKLWRLIKFWSRVGMFEQDEKGHILQSVAEAASQTKPQGAVNILQNLAGYAKGHGEVTGQDPSDFRDFEKAIERAQGRGLDQRKKAVERQKKKIEAIHNRVSSKISKRAAFEDLVAQIGQHRLGADKTEEFASQLVTLEPENITDAYVGLERGAYGSELGQLLGWRNKVVGAQGFATAEIGRFQAQIEAIKALDVQDANLTTKAPGKKGKKHKKGKAGLAGALNVSAPPGAYQKQKYKIPLLEQAIKDATTMRDETWAGELEEVQGLSGPAGLLDSLPSEPSAGLFGGRIFEIQNSIRELGLKVNTTGDDSAREIKELEAQLSTDWHKRFLVSEAQGNTIADFTSIYPPGFAGMFATGGSIGYGQWGIAGETGQAEIVQGPARVYSPSESEALTGGGGSQAPLAIEEMHIHDDGRVTYRFEGQEFEAAVAKVVRKSRATGRRTPGGAR